MSKEHDRKLKPSREPSHSSTAKHTGKAEERNLYSKELPIGVNVQSNLLGGTQLAGMQGADLTLHNQRLVGNQSVTDAINKNRLIRGETSVIQLQTTDAPVVKPVTKSQEEAKAVKPEETAKKTEEIFNITIGNETRERLSRWDAARFLWKHYGRISGWIWAERRAHQRMLDLRKDSWFVGAIADGFANPKAILDPVRYSHRIPPLEIWNLADNELTGARDPLIAGDVKAGAEKLIRAEALYSECHRIFYTYRKGTIEGAERAKTVLVVTAALGAVAATVATGGLAAQAGAGYLGVAAASAGGAGWYGIIQEGSSQGSELYNGLRKEIDPAAILRRGAVDAVTTFVGALTGGVLSKMFLSKLGPYIANVGDDVLASIGKQMGLRGPLPRDYFMTFGQRFLADYLAGVGSIPLTTAVKAVMQVITRGKEAPKSLEEFSDMVIKELMSGGFIQFFVSGIATSQAGRLSSPISPEVPPGQKIVAPPSAPKPPELASTVKVPAAEVESPPLSLTKTEPAPPFALASTMKKPPSMPAPGERPLPSESVPTLVAPTKKVLPGEEKTLPAGEQKFPPEHSGTIPPFSQAKTPRAGGAANLPTIEPPARVINPTDYQILPMIKEGYNRGKLILVDRRTGKVYLFKPRWGERQIIGWEMIPAQTRYRRAPAAEIVARELGFETPSVEIVKFGEYIGQLQEWVHSGKTIDAIWRLDQFQGTDVAESIWRSQWKKDLDIFDFLIANMDRNIGNFKAVGFNPKTGEPEKLIPIDMDAAFPPGPERFSVGFPNPKYSHQMPLPRTVSTKLHKNLQTMTANQTKLINALTKFLTDDEIAGVLARLKEIMMKIDNGQIKVVPG